MSQSNHVRTCQRLLKITADGECGPQMVSAVNALVTRSNALQGDNDALMKENATLRTCLQDKIDIIDGLAEGPQNPS